MHHPISQGNGSSSLSCELECSSEIVGLWLDAHVNSLNLLEQQMREREKNTICAWEWMIFLEVLLQFHPEHEQQREKLVH